LQSNGSVSRRLYFRILALACVDILLTLPLGVINATSQILNEVRFFSSDEGSFRLYYGWDTIHSDWGPIAVPYSEQVGWFMGRFVLYLEFWTSPILAIVIFAFFGLTAEARATYWRGFCFVAKIFGWTPPALKGGSKDLGSIEFGPRQLTATERCAPWSSAQIFPAHRSRFRSRQSAAVSVVGGPDVERGYEFHGQLSPARPVR
jgi:hypothetical protein